MYYKITFGPRNPMPGVKSRTVIARTACHALSLAEMLEASGERTEIVHPHGKRIGFMELRLLAEIEARLTVDHKERVRRIL